MALFDELKKRADVNGDSKITKEDLDAVKSPENKDKIEKLKTMADSNKDGKVDLSDAKGLDLGQIANGVKGMFSK